MLRLEKANGKNVWELLKLRVSDDQKTFVASNDISIIEAYTAITGNGYAFPFGIYAEDTPVGFLMIGFDVDDYWTDAPTIAKGNYNLWRLMIDKAYPKGTQTYPSRSRVANQPEKNAGISVRIPVCMIMVYSSPGISLIESRPSTGSKFRCAFAACVC